MARRRPLRGWIVMLFWLLASTVVDAKVRQPLEAAVDQRGDRLALDQYRGQVVAISFWASWCPPCSSELAILDGLQRLRPDALKVIAVNWKEPRSTYRRLLKQFGEVALSLTHDETGEIAEAYGVTVIPHLVLIDHRGDVAAVHKGYSEEMLDALVEEINQLLRDAVEP